MYKNKIYFALVCLLVAGCAKDPKTIIQPGVFSSASYPADINQLFNVLVPAYAGLRQAGLYGFEFRSHDLDCAGHIADLTYNGDASWNDLTNDNMNAANKYAGNVWSSCYIGIQRCNTFLDRADFYEKKYTKPNEGSDINTMRGEAHFLRALYYFYLECIYGESYLHADGSGGDKMGVPLITTLPASLDSTQHARNTVKECWDFIISELKQSAALLQGKVWDASNEGRATEWAAKALLGKVYVFTEDWADARTVLQDVIQHSGKSLMPYSKYRDAFIGINANEFNEESVFEVNVDRDPQAGYGIFSNGINLTAAEGLPLGPTVLGDDGTEDNAATMGYCNEFFHDVNLKRFGFKLPLWKLVPNPHFNSSEPPDYTNPKMIIDPAYKQASLNMRINKTVDPRLYVNALQPWVDSGSWDGNHWRPIARCGSIPLAIRNKYYGWSFRKYNTFDNNIFNYQAADGANIYVLRLADVYLLYAEAGSHTNNTADALEYLNKVKRRAYGYPIDSPSPVDYKSLSDQTSAVGDPDLGNNPLYYERWAELMGEGWWWYDICRWKIGAKEASVYKATVAGGDIQWDDNKSYVWPIPNDELKANPQMAQNAGY